VPERGGVGYQEIAKIGNSFISPPSLPPSLPPPIPLLTRLWHRRCFQVEVSGEEGVRLMDLEGRWLFREQGKSSLFLLLFVGDQLRRHIEFLGRKEEGRVRGR